MKTFSKFIGVIILLFFVSSNLHAVKTAVVTEEKSAMEIYLDMHELDGEDFLNLKAKTIRKATKKKLTLKERIHLKVVKYEMAHQMRKNADFNAEEYYRVAAGGFSLGGFLLGFFLPIIGSLIALLFGWNAFRWSLIGTLTWVVAGFIALIF